MLDLRYNSKYGDVNGHLQEQGTSNLETGKLGTSNVRTMWTNLGKRYKL